MRPVEVKPEATNPVQTIDTETASQNTLKTKDWQVYTSTGMTVKYPDTYSISTVMSDPLLTGYNIISSTWGKITVFTIENFQALPLTADSKDINGIVYRVLRTKESKSYGYAVERSDTVYVFDRNNTIDDATFELVMSTVQFEKK